MPVETRFSEGVGIPDFEVIGSGTIGEKARQLKEKTPALKRMGFHVPSRTVLADGFFQEFLSRNAERGTFDPAHFERTRWRFSREQYQAVERVVGSMDDKFVAVRSSAEGDARGTGIYQSVFVDSNVGRTSKAIQKVWASYFSDDAVAFRRDAELPDGMGVILEPMLGQSFGDGQYFAPVLSGFGYTSTPREGAYISVVPGAGGGVDSRYGEKLTRDKLADYHNVLGAYIWEESGGMMNAGDSRQSALLGSAGTGWNKYRGMLTNVLWVGNEYHDPQIVQQFFDDGSELHDTIMSQDFQLGQFFDRVEQMEQAFGKRQYFEWAMTVEEGQPKYWVLQIADVNERADFAEFQEGTPMLSAHTVTGSGQKECDKVFLCWNPSDIPNLNRFNQGNAGYVLLYPGRLTTSWGAGLSQRIRYADFNNASVVLEIQDANHAGDPISHFGGQVDMTGKFFGVLDESPGNRPNWDLFDERAIDEEGSQVYQGNVKVVASERRNRLEVYPQETE